MESTTKQQTGEICLVCEETKENGIHICNQFICTSCEEKLVQTDTDDERYGYYLEKLRKINVTDHVMNRGRPI